MEELTKRERAYAMACLVNNGYDKPRVDTMKWQPYTHKMICFRGLKSIGCVSLKKLAERFNKLSKKDQEQGIKLMHQFIGFYVEIAPNFGDQGGYHTESDINSPMFKTPNQAKKWVEELTFQDRNKYSISICYFNTLTNEWRRVETL